MIKMMQFDMIFGFDKKKMRGYSHAIPGITLTGLHIWNASLNQTYR